MKIKLVLLWFLVVLSGCEDSSSEGVSPINKARAEYTCRDRGGVYSIHLGFVRYARCNDGSGPKLEHVVPKEY